MLKQDASTLHSGQSRTAQQPNCLNGFTPAFLNAESGDIAFAKFANGFPAPVHIVEGLPENWFKQPNKKSGKEDLKQEIVSGFIREGHFFTREEATQQLASEKPNNESGSAYYDAF